MTGLGPNSTENNTALGRCYFNGNSLPFVKCDDDSSAIVQPRPVNGRAGIINIWQCREFTTDVEGIYTCIIMNSSMIYESIGFGVYFIGRGKLRILFITHYDQTLLIEYLTLLYYI